MPLQRRLPKRGFNNIFKKRWAIVNLASFKEVESGSVLDAEAFRALGLVRGPSLPVRLLAKGELDRALSFKVQYATASAIKKVQDAGGSVEITPLPKRKRKGLSSGEASGEASEQ
jgi:large subunit ribosomal protein L15